MKRILIINNIPTPYRNKFYSDLTLYLKAENVSLDVMFQAEYGSKHLSSEIPVSWCLEDMNWDFNYYISRSARKKGHNRRNINLDLLLKVLFGRWDIVMFVPAESLFSWLLVILLRRKKTILYNEKHIAGMRKKDVFLRPLKRVLWASFDVIAAPDRNSYTWVTNQCPKLKSVKFIQLRNFIDSVDSEYTSNLKDVEQAYDGKRFFLGVGTAEYKGRDSLIEMWAQSKIKDSVLVLVGDSPELASLRSLTEKLGVQNEIYFTGNLKQSEVRYLMERCDIFIHSSTYDPNPLVMVEAASLGKFIVSSTQTGNASELCGNDGLLFDISKNYSHVLAEAGALEESYLVKNGSAIQRRYLSLYNVQNVAKELAIILA